jgi:hypothetical protein
MMALLLPGSDLLRLLIMETCFHCGTSFCFLQQAKRVAFAFSAA